MRRTALPQGNRRSPVTAILLLAGLAVVAALATPAFAESPHVRPGPDTDSCAACHWSHAASSVALVRGAERTGDPSGSCLVCHDGSDPTVSNVADGAADSFALPSGHSLTTESSGTVRLQGCTTCHDAHGASADERMIPAKQVNGAIVTSAGKELCLACHDSSAAWYGPGYPSTSAPTRDATGFPVAGTWPGSTTYESPSDAHRLIPETTQTIPGVSAPIRREQGDCLYCHAAHGGANAYDGLVTTFTVPSATTLASDQADGSYAALCFTCHGGQKPAGFAETPVDIKQFATANDDMSGHRIVTQGGTLPVGAPLPCFECHNPHGSRRDNASMLSDERGESLSTTSAAGVRSFCFTCHTTSDTMAGWDSVAGAYVSVTSTDNVVGLPRDAALLRLRAHEGHAQGDSASCYQCHGNSYEVGGHNVHDPGDGRDAKSVAGTLFVLGTSTVPSASIDASVSIEGSGSVDATSSVDATTSPASAIPNTDVLPPVTIADAQPTYSGTALITLVAADDVGGTGVAQTFWDLDGGDVSTGTVVTTSTLGPHTLTYWSVDNAGNAETANTIDFTITSDQLLGFLDVSGALRGRIIADAGT